MSRPSSGKSGSGGSGAKTSMLRAEQPAAANGVGEGGGVEDLAAAGVDEDRRRLHQARVARGRRGARCPAACRRGGSARPPRGKASACRPPRRRTSADCRRRRSRRRRCRSRMPKPLAARCPTRRPTRPIPRMPSVSSLSCRPRTVSRICLNSPSAVHARGTGAHGRNNWEHVADDQSPTASVLASGVKTTSTRAGGRRRRRCSRGPHRPGRLSISARGRAARHRRACRSARPSPRAPRRGSRRSPDDRRRLHRAAAEPVERAGVGALGHQDERGAAGGTGALAGGLMVADRVRVGVGLALDHRRVAA